MTVKNPLPVPEDVQGYPNNDKAVMIYARGKIRVVERQYYWDKQKQRGLEKRNYLGYVVDNKFYSTESYNEKYKRNGKERLVKQKKTLDSELSVTNSKAKNNTCANDLLSSLRAGELPLYYAVAKDLGLVEDLTNVFGKNEADAILSIAFNWLSTGDNAAYLFNSWKEDRLLPYTDDLPSKEMSAFLKQLNQTLSWRKNFFNARLNRLPDDEMLSFDATEIATSAENIDYAHLGLGKSGGFQKQVGLIILVGHKTHMPVLFRVLPGNITDVTTVQDMLYRFDEIKDAEQRVFAAVVDRGYFSLKNLASFIDHNSRVIVAAKTEVSWIAKAIDDANSTPWGNAHWIKRKDCWGKTFPVEKKFEDGQTRKLWVHVYRSEKKNSLELTTFYDALEKFENDWINWGKDTTKDHDQAECPLRKSPMMKYFTKDTGIPGQEAPEQNNDAIDAKVATFGFFANVTTMECTASDALENYQTRDLIEKTFKAGKSLFDMDIIHSHKSDTMEGRMIVSFVALSIINHIYNKMGLETKVELKNGKSKILKPLHQEMSFKELRNKLSGIRLTNFSDGIRRWTEVTSSQHWIARRLGYPDLYVDIPTWG